MSEYRFIEFEITNKVAIIHLNRPEHGNALTPELAQELRQAALYCAETPAVRAVLLSARGKMFCAGGDVKEFARQGENVGHYTKEITHPFHAAVSQFNTMNAPVIGAINGTAAGGGFSLALAPDIVIAADTARFTMAYTNTGLSPDGSSTYFLARMIGLRRAKELALLNPVLTAEQARDWGLVNSVVPAAELAASAYELAARLAQGPSRTFGETKRLILRGCTESLETQMEDETRTIAMIANSQDGREGIEAFTEKRKPAFIGS